LAMGLGVAFVISLGLVLAPVTAQEDVSDALKKAVAFLSQKLGKPITSLDTYSYSNATFADASLDCPEDGKVYSPGAVPGYKFLLTVRGVSYDVHISTDKTLIALCTDTAIKQPSTLTLFRNPQFSIAYPDGWRVSDRTTEIYFGLGVAPICSQPGMSVTLLGPITDKTPDDLLDGYKQNPNATGAQFDPTRTSLGSVGRSVGFVAPCADGSVRQSRVTTFVTYGRGFRVWQFAPQSAYSQWADIYAKIIEQFSASAGSPNSTNPIVLPSRSPLALIAHVFAGNIYVGALTNLPGTPITTDAASDHNYRSVVVSPTGTTVAFIDPDDATLYSASAKGGMPPHKLADKLVPGYPAAFKADGSEVAYVIDSGTKAKDGTHPLYTLMAVEADGSSPRKIGDITATQANCTSNTTDPAEQLYWSAAGTNGNGLLLAWTRSGTLYYSLGCDGIGVGQIGEDGSKQDVTNDKLRRVRVAPDGTQLLGIAGDDTAAKLVRFNLSDRSSSEIPTTATPDQVGWSPDGKVLYYSTATSKKALTLDAADQKDRGLKAFAVWPFQTKLYTTSLHGIDLSTSVDVPLYGQDGRAIVNIAPSPDGAGMLFLVVQDASALVEGFQNNVSASDLRRDAPSVMLYWLPLPPGRAQLIAMTLDPVWGPMESAPAPTPTGNPANRPTFGPQKPLPTLEPGVPTVEAAE
ncbi:MAG: hypothetical protein ABI947_00255, partial [Chloroflexota bacterium]